MIAAYVRLVSTATDEPDALTGGERLLWFGGGFAVAVHLTVAVALVTFALTTDALSSRGAASEAPLVSEAIIATEFAYSLAPGDRPSGNLEITMVNEGALFHNLLIVGERGFVLEAEPGAISSAPIQLDSGVYVLYCSVPGHRNAGMEATLTIAADSAAL